MAEPTDIATGAGTAGAILGTLWAAVKWGRKMFPPSKENDMSGVLQRVATLEEQARDADAKDKSASEQLKSIYDRLNGLDKNVATILAILDEREKNVLRHPERRNKR